MVEKYGDTHSSAGWVWAIVGIIVAALIVWWIAAAVSNNEPSTPDYGSQTVGANEDYNAAEPGEAQSDEFAQTEVESDEFAQNVETDPESAGVEDSQNIGGGPVDDYDTPAQDQPAETGQIGEQGTPADESDPMQQDPMQQQQQQQQQAQGDMGATQPQELQAFSDWNQNLQGDLTPDKVDEGVGHLNEATTGVIALYTQQPQPGSQTGGGPDEGISGAISSERQKFDESIDKLHQAQGDEKAQDFKEAANDFVALLDKIQAEANVSEADQPLAQLRDEVSKIDDSQNLSEQQDKVESFFDQSSQILNTFAQNAPTSDAQADPLDQPAASPMQDESTQ